MDGRWQQVQKKHSCPAAAVSASRTAPPATQGSGRTTRGDASKCKSAYLHVRRHLYCLVTTRAATPVTTPVLPSHDACSDTCNDICIALSGRVQRQLYFDLFGRSAWSLLASVAGIAGHQYDAVF
jgi:hypothetical protein